MSGAACRHCSGLIQFVALRPDTQKDWWHVDAAGEPTSMFCGVIELGRGTVMEVAEP